MTTCKTVGCGQPVPPGADMCEMCGMRQQISDLTAALKRSKKKVAECEALLADQHGRIVVIETENAVLKARLDEI